ncbi:MAG TPA: hypothetical protein VEO01_22355, partial [Pseudonocardiaceae bacterium]|nr:hypothetical protein [Pseudonocardiaceae bacterium]
MGTLLDTATTVVALTVAWQDLLADDGADGALTDGTARFAADAEAAIAALAAELHDGTYRPRSLSW